MLKKKTAREKGKLKLSRYFQEFKKGDRVAVIIELSENRNNIPKRIQGKTGVIEEKRGNAYLVKIKEYNKEKTFIIKPIHLKKLNS